MFSVPFLTSLTSHLGITAIDDASDTLSCLITAFLFITAAILTSAKTYVGSAMECWLPQTYSGDWGEFAENYCFLKDTYFYPRQQSMTDIPMYHKERHRLTYYQWSSMYLAVAGIAFMIPKFLWRLSQSTTDMPVVYFCDTANEIKNETEDKRSAKIKEMARFMRTKITSVHTPSLFSFIRMYMVYSVIKILYLVNAIAQFVIIAIFLGQKRNLFWGWTLFMNLLNGITWETTGLFPRVTFCDFQVREMAGNNRDETVECVIGINEFNEKIFLFFWFWLVFLVFSTLIAHFYNAAQIVKPYFIHSLLFAIRDHDIVDQKELFREFGEKYLTMDGKLILSFVKSQSDLVASEVAVEMYSDFLEARDRANIAEDKYNNILKNGKQ
ncbi:Innexin-8 [Caenorhabditis elegans]|uniref:Innexin-8 n=1 Tax=Caenorhabditis elegans TaxID=6239 RepID=INX8_CAEEL|nr:Innexin-8 [Caenorhabditis elegans]Q23593.2 RecName: Full=Innexin-8; AltName: Full=Protein opu-8 [Caenorhabditis elegans]CAA92633.2 Innexin-8 [Caenorhabditis elegans]|eukprot:NP_502209.1 Innexin-8 [Caenorhabditis elegans]